VNHLRLVVASTILTLIRVTERLFGPTPDPPGQATDNGAGWTARHAEGGEVHPSTNDGIPIQLNPGQRWEKELDE
jgi:hypothetical protein